MLLHEKVLVFFPIEYLHPSISLYSNWRTLSNQSRTIGGHFIVSFPCFWILNMWRCSCQNLQTTSGQAFGCPPSFAEISRCSKVVSLFQQWLQEIGRHISVYYLVFSLHVNVAFLVVNPPILNCRALPARTCARCAVQVLAMGVLESLAETQRRGKARDGGWTDPEGSRPGGSTINSPGAKGCFCWPLTAPFFNGLFFWLTPWDDYPMFPGESDDFMIFHGIWMRFTADLEWLRECGICFFFFLFFGWFSSKSKTRIPKDVWSNMIKRGLLETPN